MWCIAVITPEYHERMYRLDLYAEAYNPDYPVICVDEKSKQMIEGIRTPIPMKPGQPEKYDYEYIRRGTGNIFVAVEPKGGRRTVKVTKTRKKADFARFVRTLVKNRYPEATTRRCVDHDAFFDGGVIGVGADVVEEVLCHRDGFRHSSQALTK